VLKVKNFASNHFKKWLKKQTIQVKNKKKKQANENIASK